MASVFDVANYFLMLDDRNDGEGISNLKLQKLCYYAQGFHAAIYDTSLFDEEIYAWMHGPVVPELYHTYKPYGRSSIPPAPLPFMDLKGTEIGLIEEVFNVFGQYSAWKLRDMTHDEPPWIQHKDSVSLIPVPAMAEYFRTRLN